MLTCLLYQIHPIAHAGLETEITLPANVIRGCSLNHFWQSTQRNYHIQIISTLIQRDYYIAESELIHPKMVNISTLDN